MKGDINSSFILYIIERTDFMTKSKEQKKNNWEEECEYLILKERRERYINYILVILIIIFLIFSIIYINNQRYKKKEEIAYTNTSNTKENDNNSFIRFIYDGFNHNNPPSKKDYVIQSVSCNNAKGYWDNKSWQLNISNIVDKVNCSLSFKKKESIIAFASNKNKLKTVKKTNKNNTLLNKKSKNISTSKSSTNKQDDNIEINNNKSILIESDINNNVDNKNSTNNNLIDNSNQEELVIKSSEYLINNDDKLINNIELKTTIQDFLNNIDNDNNLLHIYDLDNNEILDYTNYVGTGMKIKLETADKILDELEIVVLGDIDGDGKCMSSDYRLTKKHIRGQIELTGSKFIAGDINKDKIINDLDYELINKYIMKQINSFIS